MRKAIRHGIEIVGWSLVATVLIAALTPSLGYWSLAIGVVVGSIVGYVGTNFARTIKCVQLAWNKVVGYRPNKKRWIGAGYGFAVLFSVALPFGIAALVGHLIHGMSSDWILPYIVVGGLFSVGGEVYGLAALRKEKASARVMFQKALNPMNMLFVYPFIVSGIVLKWLGSILVKISRFLVEVLRLMHEHRRVVVAIDVAITATVAFLITAGNPTIIAVGIPVAFVVGLLHFELASLIFKRVPNGT